MPKIFLIGDTHIGLGFPNKSDQWLKVHIEYFNNFLIPLLRDKVKKGDIIVHLGDLFDNRNVIPINLLNYAMDIVEEISSIAPLHIIVGNHDLWTRSTSEINTIRPFKYIPNVFIYDKPTKIEFNKKSILMLPFVEKRLDQIEILKEYSGCDFLFCHSDLNGAKMHLNSVANKNLDKIDVSDFSGYKKVYTGHIHISQIIGNVNFVGSIFEMDRNDINNQKGIYIIDSNGDEEFIPNNVSPKHKKVYVMLEEDIDKLDALSTRDYIDLHISNSLLVNNRKLRRKLELILETGNFSSIEYIDDINITENSDTQVIENEIINENGEVVPKIQLEYKQFIKEYILSQSYDNEKIKNGILSEYSDIIKIYDNEYGNQ